MKDKGRNINGRFEIPEDMKVEILTEIIVDFKDNLRCLDEDKRFTSLRLLTKNYCFGDRDTTHI